MNGMVPPTPAKAMGLPKNVFDDSSSDFSSHGASSGASHPVAPQFASKLTLAPEGGSSVISSVSAREAIFASHVGGMRRESFSAVAGRNTLPALPAAGSPSAPMTASAG